MRTDFGGFSKVVVGVQFCHPSRSAHGTARISVDVYPQNQKASAGPVRSKAQILPAWLCTSRTEVTASGPTVSSKSAGFCFAAKIKPRFSRSHGLWLVAFVNDGAAVGPRSSVTVFVMVAALVNVPVVAD